nr:hydantoinase [Kwoniella mangroviensis CBS 8507]OCF63706.1 hydantoinase [Kwoniella mangroviensis CBS 8507]
MTIPHKTLRVGVDVGGTNTDAVILDLTPGTSAPVLASFKSPTTPDVTSGIQKAISGCLEKSSSDKSRIEAISIGTTSFVNSLIERDATKLEKVGVIRLCGPHSRLCPPFVSFPYELRRVLEGPVWMVEGGLQVDGREISTVDINEIRGIAAELKRQGIKTVAVSGVYSPIDHDIKQEEQVRDILQQEIPDVKVTMSKEVANIAGLLERENATILNASLLAFAKIAVSGFRQSLKSLELDIPLFLTSNDGTLMTCDQAEHFPIKTFSSGPTNSMRGANFLAGLASGGARKETALVIDVGGTTTEVGVLLPTGFPRQAGARHELCGVPLNFSMPHVHSIGLGGGSRVRVDNSSKVTVGPDSVGYRIDQSIAFGGDTLTTTDIVVADGRAMGIGNANLVKNISSDTIAAASARMKTMIELALESMKTSTQDVPVYLVGGGAILVPDTLQGVSKVHRFPFYDAANAVGAACAQVSGVIDTFEDTSTTPLAEVRKKVEQRAIDKAVDLGADRAKTTIVESEIIPIAYTTGRARFYVKAAGPWTGAPVTHIQSQKTASAIANKDTKELANVDAIPPANIRKGPLPESDPPVTAQTILDYRPTITNQGEWMLSEIDAEWIATGCYILGCGGGGSPYSKALALKEIIRAGESIKIIDFSKLEEDGMVIWGGGIGSPEVSQERLVNEEYNEAVSELMKFLRMDKCAALAALEIGGGNGMINMITGASAYLDIPILDGDFMGRAYPTGWQTTPNVYDLSGRGEMLLPSSMASGDGTVTFMTKARSDRDVDAVERAACVEMGTHAGAAQRPLTKPQCEQAMIKNTVSQAWRLGRAVALANKQSNVGNIGKVLVEALGGSRCAKVLFNGKVTNVNRRIYKGHTIGEIVIQALKADEEEDEDPKNPKEKFEGIMTIPFKNENLMCQHEVNGVTKITAGVPDLISVIDSQTGEALGTPDYKYGLRVMVIGVTAAPQWTDTPRGIEIGGLGAFGYDDIPYEPIGVYEKPVSVIDEYVSV